VLIRFYNVTKVYPSGATGLVSVNTAIRKGEFLFLVVPARAGKTTFLKLLTREIVSTRGQVLVNGRNITRLKAWGSALFAKNGQNDISGL